MSEKEVTVPLVEERLTVGKRKVLDDRVTVDVQTTTTTERVDVDLLSEDVDVERVPIGRTVMAAPHVRVEGDVTIVPILEERLVVEKRLVLVEEVRIRRKSVFRKQSVEAELRRQSARVDRKDADETSKET